VAGARGTKTQHRQGGANRENVTATICADGTTLCPTVKFKGKNLYTRWTTNNENGWTNSKIMCEWIR
ncbi:hypothetical protein BT96DRAFT_774762, partial [Gymnopus androsaceus JB14]